MDNIFKNFAFKDGALHIEGLPVKDIAKSVKTPFYVYSSMTLQTNYVELSKAFSKLNHSIYFSVKSNSNLAVLKTLSRIGAGMDIVSGGEYRRAEKAGVPGEKIVFSGVGKTVEEIELALSNGIRQFNVESIPEIELLNKVAKEKKTIAPVSVRINPDVDAKTHKKIMTGTMENKFGIPISLAYENFSAIKSMANINIVGVDVHIGSQITQLAPFHDAFKKVYELIYHLNGNGFQIERVDIGGGLGISYERNQKNPIQPVDFADLVSSIFGDLDLEIQIEPGRFISGNSGLLISSVIYLKEGANKNFLVIDAGMNDLLRPALYDSKHEILPVIQNNNPSVDIEVDVVGPICESSDLFRQGMNIPKLDSGDLVAICSAGAYGAVMSSEYNTRPLIPEVLVEGDRFAVVRKRPSVSEIINRDLIPEWLL